MCRTVDEATQTVFVVDDDAALRDALATLLEAEGWACEPCADASAFLAKLADWPPQACGCVVLDVRMPGESGFDVQAHLNAHRIDLPVIFITGYGDVPAAVRAMKGGAVDFLTKPFDVQALLQRIRTALQANAERRTVRCELQTIRARAATLSPRERQVFERVASGQANKIVALDLGVSERTVEIHRSHVMRKMRVRNLADLVRSKLALEAAARAFGPEEC